jgi:hypothetical protein
VKPLGAALAVLAVAAFGVVHWLDGLVGLGGNPRSGLATWGHTAPLALLGVFLMLGGPHELSRRDCATFICLTAAAVCLAQPWSPLWFSGDLTSLALVATLALSPMIYGLGSRKIDLTNWRDSPHAPKDDR